MAQVASLAIVAAATAVLSGWLLDIPQLTSLYLPGPTVKTNAAVCLLFFRLLLSGSPFRSDQLRQHLILFV